MKFFSRWQPLVDEDAHNALVFGFLRHAPAGPVLDSWLSKVLDRSVAVEEPLAPHHFWPNYRSLMPGCTRTEPELVFQAHDGRPITVVVEVKPSFDQHYFEQIAREAIDTTADTPLERLAVIMVGADLEQPAHSASWEGELRKDLARRGFGHVEAELHYSSWASLGTCIEGGSEDLPQWRRYAEDVVHHLRLKGLLGYEGGPMFDDLEELTVVNAVELFNRTVKAARQLLLAVHSQHRFQAAGYEPFAGGLEMVRDGTSTAITQRPEWFETSMLLSTYRKPSWLEGAGVYIAFWLTPGEGVHPHLQVGAFHADDSRGLVWAYASAEDADELTSDDLGGVDRTLLQWVSIADQSEWVYADRPWRPGRANEDVAWALDAVEAGSKAWDG